MKRIVVILLAGIITVPIATFGRSSHIARADVPRYTSVPLDSLPLVQSDSNHANIISTGSLGHYRDMTIRNGVQLLGCQGAAAEFNLHGKYDELSGAFYNEGPASDDTPGVTIEDASNPNQKQTLYSTGLTPAGQAHFRIRVQGVAYVVLTKDYKCNDNSNVDSVATLSSGSLPPTQVVPCFPTGNAGEPANSRVRFGWQPFPGAANYAFHIWMISQSGTVAITPSTPVTLSTLVYHKTTYMWDDHGFLPGTYQYALLPLDATGKALAGWGTPVQITIAG